MDARHRDRRGALSPRIHNAAVSAGEDQQVANDRGAVPGADEQATPALPMKAVSATDSAESAPAEAEESATGSVPAQGVTGVRMARTTSKKTRRSVPSWDEILFGSKS